MVVIGMLMYSISVSRLGPFEHYQLYPYRNLCNIPRTLNKVASISFELVAFIDRG